MRCSPMAGFVLALFGASPVLAADLLDDRPAVPGGGRGAIQTVGFVKGVVAGTYAGADHWSTLRQRVDVGASNSLGEDARWRPLERSGGDQAYVLEGKLLLAEIQVVASFSVVWPRVTRAPTAAGAEALESMPSAAT